MNNIQGTRYVVSPDAQKDIEIVDLELIVSLLIQLCIEDLKHPIGGQLVLKSVTHMMMMMMI